MAMQSIIVYRNPMEAAMWEGIMNSDFPVMLFIVANLVISVCLFGFIGALTRNPTSKLAVLYRRHNDAFLALILATSTISSYLIFA